MCVIVSRGVFQLDWVFEAFDNSHCPLLQNKPKMFFVQACRGGKALVRCPLSPRVTTVVW